MDEKGNEKKKRSALEVLTLAASLVNPREFELPKELQLPIMFPGSNKVDYMSGRRGKLLSSSYNNGRQDKIVCIFSFFFVLSLVKIKLYFCNINYHLTTVSDRLRLILSIKFSFSSWKKSLLG